MVYLFLTAGAVVFVVCFKLLDVVGQARAVVAVARQAHGIIRSETLSDDAKEAAAQKATIVMAGSGGALLGRMALCLMAPIGAVWLGAQSGAYTPADALTAATDWPFMVASGLLMMGVLMVLR